MEKQFLTKEDGRYIIFYEPERDDPVEGPEKSAASEPCKSGERNASESEAR